MIHASVELIWMMLGYAINDGKTFAVHIQDYALKHSACGQDITAEGYDPTDAIAVFGTWHQWWNGKVVEHEHAVTCDACRVSMDAALEGRCLTKP